METLGSYQAKTHLPRLLDRVARGESITITRHGRFDPRSVRRAYTPEAASSSDGSAILPATRGFCETVEMPGGRRNFVLYIAGVNAFSITAYVSGAGLLDPGRLEATLLGLRDENTRAAALVKFAETRLKTAKAAEAKAAP